MWTKIYRWLFGEKKPSNVIFTNSADGNGMTYEQAIEKAKDGFKVSRIDWYSGKQLYYQDELMVRIIYKNGSGVSPYIPTEADKISSDWYVCGRVE